MRASGLEAQGLERVRAMVPTPWLVVFMAGPSPSRTDDAARAIQPE